VLELWPPLLLIAAVVIGLLVGSFLNVVAYRVPRMMERAWREQCADSGPTAEAPATEPADAPAPFNLWWPPSTCPSCGARIAARHNVPIVSYLLLRGRCAACGEPISRRYPFVEAFAALLSLVAALVFGPTWQLVAALGFTWSLLALSLIDIDHHLLPDSITLPLLWAGLLISLLSFDGEPLFTDLQSSVIGAAAGYLALWTVYHLFKLVTGKEGMGYGDFKLLGAIGAWLGWQMLPLVILLSAAVGAVLGSVMLLAAGKSRQTPIPFGPYLAAAGWIALLWGDRLVDWYAQFLR
jgi:leader peptidase (prepilin peptidase) / N-methyltransferase